MIEPIDDATVLSVKLDVVKVSISTKILAYTLGLISAFSVSAAAQDDVVATATGISIKRNALPADVAGLLLTENADAAELRLRAQLFEEFLNRKILRMHFEKTGKTVTDINAELRSKLKAPTDQEIATVIDQNRQALADVTPAEARSRVVNFLNANALRSAYNAYVAALRLEYKASSPADAASPNKRPTDAVATIDGKAVQKLEFDRFVAIAVFNQKYERLSTARAAVAEMLYGMLVEKEAATLGIRSDQLIQREVSSKFVNFTDEEFEKITAAFRERLFAKYNASIKIDLPAAPRLNIPLDGSPSDGPADARVTIVMFSDFQCSACVATHPVIKKLVAEFAGRVRFVVKYFPLESIHDRSLAAARAAEAARSQGKFWQYADALYAENTDLSDDKFTAIATRLGLDLGRFQTERAAEASLKKVYDDLLFGNSNGLLGTPSIFVNGEYIAELSEDTLNRSIAQALK